MEGIWFNDKTPRRIQLRSATLLVGKAPTKQKRIKSTMTMKLDSGGENQIAGLPEWLENARDFVMRNGETITASDKAVQECNIVMGDENLFRKTPTEAPKSRIDHFQIKQMGEADDPDTVLCFEMRSPFSTDLWGWLGQMGGEEFDVTFELVAAAPGGELTLTSEDEDEEEDPEVLDAQNNHGQDDEDLTGPEHDEEFRTTPLMTHRRRRTTESAIQ